MAFDEAEARKKSGELPDNYSAEILAPFLESAALEVTRAIQFFYTSTPYTRVAQLFLAGGCALIPGLLDIVAARTKISSAVVSPFKGMSLGPSVREQQLRSEAPAYLVACGLALRRFARRKQKKAAFVALLGVSAVAGALVVMVVGGYNAAAISTQTDRNNVLVAANAALDVKIAEIATLKQEIEALKARQQAVEDLQGDRNQPVYLLEELVRQTPQGVHLRSFSQDGQRVTMTGYAQSQERVAELLRNLASASPWLERPELVEVKSMTLAGSKTGKRVNEFTLSVGVKR
eukprot:gene24899-45811_t